MDGKSSPSDAAERHDLSDSFASESDAPCAEAIEQARLPDLSLEIAPTQPAFLRVLTVGFSSSSTHHLRSAHTHAKNKNRRKGSRGGMKCGPGRRKPKGRRNEVKWGTGWEV